MRQTLRIVVLTANQWETVNRCRQYFEQLDGRGAGELGKERSDPLTQRSAETDAGIDKLVEFRKLVAFSQASGVADIGVQDVSTIHW